MPVEEALLNAGGVGLALLILYRNGEKNTAAIEKLDDTIDRLALAIESCKLKHP